MTSKRFGAICARPMSCESNFTRLRARSQNKFPEGAKSFAMKSTRQGSNYGELLYVHPLQLLCYSLRSSLFYYLANVTWGLRHESWCNISVSQRPSSQYVIVHGHVAYAPFID